jgi:transposase-like protein
MVQITRRCQGNVGRSTTAPLAVDPYEQLEDFARQSIQRMLQSLLEEEVDNLLGRTKSERRHPGCPSGSRNGYGKERRLATSIGTVRVRRPRVRDTEEPFLSRVLPLFRRRTREVGELLPQLYLHGLSCGDFELAMRGLLGEGAPLSASSIARLKESWTAEFITWKQRSLKESDIVYLWVDGIYVKAGLEKDKATLLVVIGARADGTKEVLAVECGQRESEASWSSILRDLKARGMNCPRLVMGDGHLGIWAALAAVFPEADEQRCWNHRMRNVLDRVGKKKQGAAKELLSKIMYAPTKREAEAAKQVFQAWARSEQYERAATLLEEDWDRMVTYYSFPQEHWLHLRTTNVIESPFASVRLRTAASKRYKRVEGATTMIWKLLMVAEQTFRKLNAPEQLIKVYAGIKYEDGQLPGRLRSPVSPAQQEQTRAA